MDFGVFDFWPKSAIFNSHMDTQSENEVNVMKTFFWVWWTLFGADRKKFRLPAPQKRFFRVQKILSKATFGSISVSSRLLQVYGLQRWGEGHEKFFSEFLDLIRHGPKIILSPHSKTVVFRYTENSTKIGILILDQKTDLRYFSKMLLGP